MTGSSPRVRGKPSRSGGRSAPPGLIPARAGKTPRRAGGPVCVWAHPRACGENDLGDPGFIEALGSSPRVRGKHHDRNQLRRQQGLIPARAGKTWRVLTGTWLLQAHPRACGENVRGFRPAGAGVGSSPRVRGKLHHWVLFLGRPGLIPARAGKTEAARAAYRPGRAHPRACGENHWGIPVMSRAHGSSPRVRGKRPDAPDWDD